jgi:hypothetical protein
MSSTVEVRPLTSTNAAGIPYTRFEATEIQIGMMLLLLHPAWILAAPDLLAETLVYLIREIHGRDDELFGLLAAELSKRVYRIGGAFALGFDVITKEAILWRVEQQIFDLVLAETPSRQSEFLEIAFGQAVERRPNDAVEKHEASTWGRRGDVPGSPIGDDDGEEIDRIEYAADGRPGQEATLLQREDVAVRRKWYRQARRAVKNPRDLEAVTLRYCEGWAITSSDPSVPTIVRHLNETEGKVRYRIDRAKKQMREALGGKI